MKTRIKKTAYRLLRRFGPWIGRTFGSVHIAIQPGHCPCCDRETVFVSLNQWFRDHLFCSSCRSIPRQRALMRVIEDRFPDWREMRIHESSPSAGGASGRLRAECPGYVATQFFPGRTPGETVRGFRNEDLGAQTFEDASFDLVITQDVMEHVYEPEAVFREISRTLRPGGAHVFTVPLINRHASTEVWARMNPDGSPRFLGNPEWHGNPVSAEGSPVTMHWGADIVEHIRRATGDETEILQLDVIDQGIRAEFIEVLVTRRGGHSPLAVKSAKLL